MRKVVEELEKANDVVAANGEGDHHVLSWGCSYLIVLDLIFVD